MTWYCGHCHYPNAVNDAYCCNCYRIKDNIAFKNGGLPSIITLTGPLTSRAPCYNTHDDDHHEHCEVPPSNRLDLGLTSGDGTSAPAQDPHDGKWRKFWYCCNCGDGPHGAGNIPACPSCPHVQCTRCDVVRLKT
jgi:hypothetical protein